MRCGSPCPPTGPTCGPPPHGVADLAEEVARVHGYSRIERRQPSWPEPGGLTDAQRERPAHPRGAGRTGRQRGLDVVAGRRGREPAGRLRRAVGGHHQPDVGGPGVPSPIPDGRAAARTGVEPRPSPGFDPAVRGRGRLRTARPGPGGHGTGRAGRCAAGDAARRARAPLGDLRRRRRRRRHRGAAVLAALVEELGTGRGTGAPTRAGRLAGGAAPDPFGEHRGGGRRRGGGDGRRGRPGGGGRLRGRPAAGRAGWRWTSAWWATTRWCPAEASGPGRSAVTRLPMSTWPWSWRTPSRPTRLADVLRRAGGELLESVTLFDVYRGPGVGPGRRSLAFPPSVLCTRPDAHRSRGRGAAGGCVEAAERELRAALR